MAVNRRAFFSQGFARALERAARVLDDELAPARFVRPPGALPESAFLAACTRCGACADACPPHAIRLLGADTGLAVGTPALELALTACTMCADMPCAAACPTDALDVPPAGWRGVRLASLSLDTTRCLPFQDVQCGICARICPVGEQALALDEQGRPVLGDGCTGCGACVQACVTTPSSLTASPR